MARPARFSADDILDGAADVLRERGRPPTIAEVSRAVGAPSGSIYHRFTSHDELLARLWIRSISRFHVGLLQAYEAPTADEAVVAIAQHIPQFCRQHPRDAIGMTLFRQRSLVTSAPEHLREQVEHINDEVNAASRSLVRWRYGRITQRRVEVLSLATRQCPYGLVRPFVGSEVPAWLDDAVTASTRAIAALGES